MSAEKQWRQVGQLEEIIFHALLQHNQQSNCIEIYQDSAVAVNGNTADFYYAYNLDTNECSKLSLPKEAEEVNEENSTVFTLHSNVKFTRDDTMYLKMNTSHYSVKLPTLITNFSYIVDTNGDEIRHIIIFGGLRSGGFSEAPSADIVVFDCVKLQWFSSAVPLPMALAYTSCVMIKKVTPVHLVLNWFRECNVFPISELVDLIVAYSSRCTVYLCGGIDAENQGNDKMYKIDLQDLDIANAAVMDEEEAARLTLIEESQFEAVSGHEIWENHLDDFICYEQGRDCVFLPCKHVVCEKSCFEEFTNYLRLHGTIGCPLCGNDVTGGYQIM